MGELVGMKMSWNWWNHCQGRVQYIYIYTHRADAASQIDENKELMPNIDGRGHSLDRLPARVVRAGIALL